MGGVSNLCEQRSPRRTKEDCPKTKNTAGNHEHGQILRAALNSRANTADSGTKGESNPSPEAIVNKRDEGGADQAADWVCGVKETKGCSFWLAKVGTPAFDGLQTIHHRAIEAIRTG
jgi:hypothetical protein